MEISINFPFKEFEKIPLFQGIPGQDLLRLVQAAHPKQTNAGEYFYWQGDPAECMYILLQGRVKLSQIGSNGQQALLQPPGIHIANGIDGAVG